MVEVQTLEVDAKHVPISLWLSRVEFGSHCLATQEFIVVQQWVSLEPMLEKQRDPWVPVVAQQWNPGTH
jgi:hypothetical protein